MCNLVAYNSFMNEMIFIFALAALGSVVALLGGVFFLFSKKWSDFLATYSVPFAAGVLLSVSLVGLLPEALHMMGEEAFTVVLFSFLAAYLFEHFVFDIHHHEGHTHSVVKRSIPLVIVGDTIHNFIDGVAIAATYFASPGLGIITTLSTFLHEVPHEIGDFGILLKAGWKRKKIFLVNFLSASATFLGAGFVLFLSPSETVSGFLLAVAAGLFLYLGASDFLPHIHEGQKNNKNGIVALILGVAIMLFSFTAVPHSHDGEHMGDEHETDESIDYLEDEHLDENDGHEMEKGNTNNNSTERHQGNDH